MEIDSKKRRFFDNKVQMNRQFGMFAKFLTLGQRNLYRFYRTEALKPRALLDFMGKYTDFGTSKAGGKRFQNS